VVQDLHIPLYTRFKEEIGHCSGSYPSPKEQEEEKNLVRRDCFMIFLVEDINFDQLKNEKRLIKKSYRI
jgi:hypothetical protein